MVRGVDIQSAFAQLNQVEQFHNQLVNNPAQQQRLLALQQHQQSLLRKITVQKANGTEAKQIDPDGHKGSRYQRDQQQSTTGEDAEPDAEDMVLKQQVGIGSKIDISS